MENIAARNANRTKMIILTAVFAAVACVCAQIQIPMTPVPINLGTLAFFLAGGLLGPRYGSMSAIVYVLLGAFGMPVFAGFKGGLGAISGPTGGYIVGYIFIALITGIFAEKFAASMLRKDSAAASVKRSAYLKLALGMVLGLFVCYLLGTVWFIILMRWSLGKTLMACVIVFLPGDALKIIAATALVSKIKPHVSRFIK